MVTETENTMEYPSSWRHKKAFHQAQFMAWPSNASPIFPRFDGISWHGLASFVDAHGLYYCIRLPPKNGQQLVGSHSKQRI
jgi:hypothetical protein